jgi:hypothetical protein
MGDTVAAIKPLRQNVKDKLIPVELMTEAELCATGSPLIQRELSA